MRDGGYLVVIAQWSEHLQLKQRALTEFNCQWQPAFYFFFYWLVPANMSCLFVCLFVCLSRCSKTTSPCWHSSSYVTTAGGQRHLYATTVVMYGQVEKPTSNPPKMFL